MTGKEEYPFYEGALVKAVKVITECGDPSKANRQWTKENPGIRGRVDPGFVHAEEGDYGKVEHIDGGLGNVPTVRFFNTGTATIVGRDEISFVD